MEAKDDSDSGIVYCKCEGKVIAKRYDKNLY